MSKRLNKTEWADYICDDLLPILTLLQQKYALQVDEVIHDLKAVNTDVYLKAQIPDHAFAQLKTEFGINENLTFGAGWIACKRDYCSINPRTSPTKSKSIMGKFRSVFMKSG